MIMNAMINKINLKVIASFILILFLVFGSSIYKSSIAFTIHDSNEVKLYELFPL